MYLVPLLLFTLLLNTACGKKTNDNNKKIVTITPEQIENLLENQSFECSSLDGGHCPEGLARLFILNIKYPTQTVLCSAFLISTNRLVSNHHCISSQEQCNNTYVSVFNGNSFEVAKCRTVVAAQVDEGTLSEKKIDFAVLELDRHIRTSDSFAMTNSTPKAGDKLTAWVVDHVNLFIGRITQLDCKLNNSVDSIELENCPAISGNSGSPVVNERGKVVGVLWGSTTSDYINEETPLEERRQLNDQAYVTSVKYFRSVLTQ